MKQAGPECAVLARGDDRVRGDQGLQALPSHVAVLDENGAIVLVNRAWTDFAVANGGVFGVAVGANYLDVCRRASRDDAVALRALEGLDAVLSGARAHFEMEYPCDSPTQRRWFAMSVDALDPRRPLGAIVSHQDISARKLAEQALAESEQRARAVFDLAAVGMAEISRDGRWLRANPAMLRLTGRTEAELLTRTVGDITHEQDIDADAAYREVLISGGAESCAMETRLTRPDGAIVWTETALSCVRGADGAVVSFIAVVNDISDRKLAEERQMTMMRELAHRGKNLLAVVQSVAQRSLAGERPLAEAREAFEGRLRALAATYGALTDESFEGAPLEAVLGGELSAFGARAHVEGPNFVLTVKAAQTFGLVAHELATNAAKYGALSSPRGRLEVSWTIEPDEDGARLAFDWRERGGPPCAEPQRKGFGAMILSRIAGAEFDCRPELIYAPEGFRYRFVAPCARIGAEAPVSPVRCKLKSDVMRAFYDQWSRLRGPNGELPKLAHFDWRKFAATGALTLASILADGELRFVEIGRALTAEFKRAQSAGGLEGEALVEAYRRCAEKADACHEYLRFDFGDGDPLAFERLLVPFSATGVGKTTHVAGLVLFDGRVWARGSGGAG
jgi:PAS domain S-box-containing protein